MHNIPQIQIITPLMFILEGQLMISHQLLVMAGRTTAGPWAYTLKKLDFFNGRLCLKKPQTIFNMTTGHFVPLERGQWMSKYGIFRHSLVNFLVQNGNFSLKLRLITNISHCISIIWLEVYCISFYSFCILCWAL